MSVDVYGTEPERQAAINEVTRLRRQFDTTTAKGAKAFAASPEAQAALARLDAAKSAAGMRTSAQDLATLNRIATSDTATMKKGEQGKMTAAPTRAERDVTKQLNAPSRQYFKQLQQAYRNPDKVPTWTPDKTVTPEMLEEYEKSGTDASKARWDWVWTENPETGEGRWGIGLIGILKQKPTGRLEDADRLDIFYSDSAPIGEARKITKRPSYNAAWNTINLDELEQAIPELTFSQLQELYYQLTLERDTDITIEDIMDKYDKTYGEG